MLISRKFMRPADWGRKIRPGGQERRILLVDPDPGVAATIRLCLLWHGIGDAEVAVDADEALDLLGASRQRLDLVLMAYPLPDEAEIDIAGVLRTCHSPVRLARYGGFLPAEVRCPAAFVGTAALIDGLDASGIARQVARLIDTPVRVADIVGRHTVPNSISPVWASAVYGAAPGQTFSSNRHQLAP